MVPARSIARVLKVLKKPSSIWKYRTAFGQWGEKEAVRFLCANGYRILEKNFRTRAGELDLIAQQGDQVVFVEVKARRGGEFGEPQWAVHERKRRRMIRAALYYLGKKRWHGRSCRFDVVAIEQTPSGEPRIRLIPNAFGAEGSF